MPPSTLFRAWFLPAIIGLSLTGCRTDQLAAEIAIIHTSISDKKRATESMMLEHQGLVSQTNELLASKPAKPSAVRLASMQEELGKLNAELADLSRKLEEESAQLKQYTEKYGSF